MYRQYTDATFSTPVERSEEDASLGMLGPVLRGAVGDTLEVVFTNKMASYPASMHPHGVMYGKASEGSPYSDGTTGADKSDDAVPPGGNHTYVWEVTESAAPGPADPSSLVWMYHSHTDETADTLAGLVGAIVVGRREDLRDDLTAKDVDRCARDPAGQGRAEREPAPTSVLRSGDGSCFGWLPVSLRLLRLPPAPPPAPPQGGCALLLGDGRAGVALCGRQPAAVPGRGGGGGGAGGSGPRLR